MEQNKELKKDKQCDIHGVSKCDYFTNSVHTKKANTCDNCQRPFEEH